ncbi:MAG: hypothetical protein ASARMPRED_002521 [Alectoria sarmentosa]|nr:MAG: hypothetical protein ASARMPRED_002521 [Alectoria sarmentosa]
MAFPTSLSSLNVREAITDAIYRCVLGLDTDDQALFDSAFTPDASFDLNGTVMSGLDAIHTGCYDTVSKLDTTHFISNVRVNVRGGDDDGDSTTTASMTASALAQHYRRKQGTEAGATRLLTGSLYFLDLVKDGEDGLWKIKHWRLQLVWTEGDWGVMTGK